MPFTSITATFMLRHRNLTRPTTAPFVRLIQLLPAVSSDLVAAQPATIEPTQVALVLRLWKCCDKAIYVSPVVEQVTGDSQTTVTHGARDVLFGERHAHTLSIAVGNLR
jgi:hypothetical protein